MKEYILLKTLLNNPFGQRDKHMNGTPVGRFGWVSQYIGGKVYLCGGAEWDVFNECYSLVIGSTFWVQAGTLK